MRRIAAQGNLRPNVAGNCKEINAEPPIYEEGMSSASTHAAAGWEKSRAALNLPQVASTHQDSGWVPIFCVVDF
jgi:hypothetical protein